MATSSRLPGIYFETAAPPPRPQLPRMDIAAFAGFLPSGPVGIPFVVEDSSRFEEIFGTDLPLAWDNQNKQMVLAQTPPSVRAYFRNGGKRCWVLRLANNPLPNAWVVPGLLQADALGRFTAGWVQARSEGSWSDGIAVNAVLLESPLPAGSLQTSGSAPRVSGLSTGDTVQLYFPSTATWAYHTCSDPRWFWFQSAQPGDVGVCSAAPPHPQPDSVVLLGPGVCTPLVFTRFCGSESEFLLNFLPDQIQTVQPGSWLEIRFGSRILLLQAETVQAPESATLSSPISSEAASLTAVSAWWVLDPAAAWAANSGVPVQASIVEFELFAVPSGSSTLQIADLGLAPDHPRYWGLLPTDAALYAPVVEPGTPAYSALSADIDHPRFPLAGVGPGGVGLPLGMSTLIDSDLSQAASMPGNTALDRDGLANFAASLFIDPALASSNSTTLLADAFAMQYQAQTPAQPRGLFALLSIDEISLLSAPDATLNGWTQSPVLAPTLGAPDPLGVSFPDASGKFTVSWTAVPGGSGYLLDQSTDPTFSTAVSETDMGAALSAEFAISPACPQQLYFRASAYGTAGTGPWSETGSVLLGTGDFANCTQLPLLAPKLLLIQLPNRLQLEWIPSPGGADGFTLEMAEDPRFASAAPLYSGVDSSFEYWHIPGPPIYFRVSVQRSGQTSPWSNTVSTTPAPISPWTANSSPVAPLMPAVHMAMLRIAAARGDLVAIFSLPSSYRTTDAVAYPAMLFAAAGSREPQRIFSYGAVYHPWLVIRDSSAPLPLSLRTIPPDGPVCGAIASMTLASGAWIAPANTALRDVLALEPVLAAGAEAAFDSAQVNLIAQHPEGFLILGQDTLITVEDDLIPLNVRRLLILIRRLALREGVRYVFKNISPTFQRQVTRQFNGWMQQLLARGAFAGLSAQDSYRVIADQSVNPQSSIDQGRFVVQLQVAPSVPMRFLTVQLTQSDGQLSLVEA